MTEVLDFYSLYLKLGKLSHKFDSNASLNVGKHHIKLTDGTFVRCGGFADFITQYNTYCADIIDPKSSYQSGLRYYLKLKDAEQPKVEAPLAEVHQVAVEDSNSVLQEPAIIEVGDVVEPVGSVDTPDWEYVESLTGSRADKQALDEYAEKFGVKLNKGKKIGDMVADFKEQYNK